jgi:hypothetical protein
MIFGMTTYTLVHVVLSLIGVLSGLVVLRGFLKSSPDKAWTQVFLGTTAATSLTGFGFPLHGFTPAIGVGILSCVILALALAALYAFRLAGAWRRIYVIACVVALYFNVFVLVVQGFLKVPALHALAPNGNEPPFTITQAVVLAAFIWTGTLAVRRFRPAVTA